MKIRHYKIYMKLYTSSPINRISRLEKPTEYEYSNTYAKIEEQVKFNEELRQYLDKYKNTENKSFSELLDEQITENSKPQEPEDIIDIS